ALLALCVRSSAVSFFASAFPPFNPPSRPRATAAAFFFFAMQHSSHKSSFDKSPFWPRTRLLKALSLPRPWTLQNQIVVSSANPRKTLLVGRVPPPGVPSGPE